MQYSGRWALVTGASSGIGWQISDQLAKRGCNIIGVSNQPSRLEDLKNHLERSHSVQVMVLNQDLAGESAAKSVFRFCRKQQVEVDILVNCAGMLLYGEMAGAGYHDMRSVLQLHVTAPALLCRLFGERMKKEGAGYILNVSSISAVMPYPTISVYGPTKAFLRHFTRAVRTELKPFGVHVTCLLPGATDTPLNDPMKFNMGVGKKIGLVKDPASVAKAGIDALFRNRAVCIPGFLNKLIIGLLPLLPYCIISLIYKRINRTST